MTKESRQQPNNPLRRDRDTPATGIIADGAFKTTSGEDPEGLNDAIKPAESMLRERDGLEGSELKDAVQNRVEEVTRRIPEKQ